MKQKKTKIIIPVFGVPLSVVLHPVHSLTTEAKHGIIEA